jgi:hypothetical protein
VHERILSGRVVRIKVWNATRRIVYSDDRGQIARSALAIVFDMNLLRRQDDGANNNRNCHLTARQRTLGARDHQHDPATMSQPAQEPAMTPEQQVQLLADRAAISDVLHRYATGLDMRDWALYRSIFTDEVDIDLSSTGPGQPAERLPADELVERARVLFAGFDATQHLSANHVHDIRGDEATCTSYMRAEHFVITSEGENYYTMGGYYTNQLVRTAAGWKLRGVTLTVTWNRGNRHVLRLAARRGRERLGLTAPSA